LNLPPSGIVGKSGVGSTVGGRVGLESSSYDFFKASSASYSSFLRASRAALRSAKGSTSSSSGSSSLFSSFSEANARASSSLNASI